MLWNTRYLERAVAALRGRGVLIPEAHLKHLSPLGWEHINLTGDYTWAAEIDAGADEFRPLREPPGGSQLVA